MVAALLVLALLWLLGRRAPRAQARYASRRGAGDPARRRSAALRRTARARRPRNARRARREEATAREQAAHAESKQEEARDRHLQAASVDPDVDEREAAELRPEAPGRITSHGGGEDDGGVEHHEETRTADEEHERHYERDEEGDVVRDEEYRRPRA